MSPSAAPARPGATRTPRATPTGTPTQAAASAGPGRGRRLLLLAWPAALLVLGAVVLAAAWGRWSLTGLFAVAAVVPLLLLRGALVAGLSRWFASSMLVLLTLLGGYLLTTGAELSLAETVRDVVPRLLTSPQPYAAAPDLLAGPLLLTALVSLLVGLRVDSRLRVEPVAGGAVLYVAGMLLTAGEADPWGVVAVLLLVVALLGWVLLDEHAEPVGQRISLAAPLAVIGVGALAAVATVPAAEPFDPRSTVEPPSYQVTLSNPLSRLGAWALNETAPLLRVRGPAVPLRLLVLDEYDGTQWTAATSYQALPADGRTGLAGGPTARAATVQVTLDGLGGHWLPSPGTPTSIGYSEALLDAGSGTLYTLDEAPDGLSYEVSGLYDDPPDAALPAAALPADAPEAWTRLPTMPPALADYALDVAAAGSTPYEKARAIERQLRTEYRYSPGAISGSALWRLEDFLLGGNAQAGGRVGTAEQFAASFAVMARYNGLPARVVMGFRPGTEQEDGSRLIVGEDALAWPEVYFRDLGWVPFSPIPGEDTFDRDLPIGSEEAAGAEDSEDLEPSVTETPGEESTTEQVPSDGPSSTAPAGTRPGDGTGGAAAADRPGPGLLGQPWLLAATTLLVAVALLLVLRVGRRVRHRRRGAIGAWAEVLDALQLAGVRTRRGEPADLYAAAADAVLQISAATTVAHGAQRAAFAPARVDGDRGGDGHDADEVRRDLRTVRRAARRHVPLWRRWWWWLDPRVLLRR